MERRDEKNLGELIDLLESAFEEVRIVQQRATEALFLLRGEIVVAGFDNSEDRRAQILKYGKRNWKKHFRKRVPHQHTFDRKEMRLTDEMGVVDFIAWLKDHLDTYLADYPADSIRNA